jgi:type VI secretion system lysozyme-like protein
MTGPRSIDGAQSLLFEKLIDLDPKSSHDPQEFRVLGLDDLKASIKRELERLLDTRRSVGIGDEKITPPPETVLDYGLPDWSTLSPTSGQDMEALARAARIAIRAFEPRLLDPVVTVVRPKDGVNRITLVIKGSVRLDTVVEPVSFPIDFSNVVRL